MVFFVLVGFPLVDRCFQVVLFNVAVFCGTDEYETVEKSLDDFVYLVELAVSEICTNIIQHAYQAAGGKIRGSLTRLDNGIQIDLYDDGESFEPEAIPAPAHDPVSPHEGGYGLHIVRQIMDSVRYQANTPKGNHWRLIKYIPPDDRTKRSG